MFQPLLLRVPFSMQDPHLPEKSRLPGLARAQEQDLVLELRPEVLLLDPPVDSGVDQVRFRLLFAARSAQHRQRHTNNLTYQI